MEHPALENRWQGEFETAPIPEQTYDLAIAFNVVEHIKNSRSFIDRVAAILKPGGVFWALTPVTKQKQSAKPRIVPLMVACVFIGTPPGVKLLIVG